MTIVSSRKIWVYQQVKAESFVKLIKKYIQAGFEIPSRKKINKPHQLTSWETLAKVQHKDFYASIQRLKNKKKLTIKETTGARNQWSSVFKCIKEKKLAVKNFKLRENIQNKCKLMTFYSQKC